VFMLAIKPKCLPCLPEVVVVVEINNQGSRN